MKKSKIHLVFGPQGAGKTTYSKRLSKELGAVHMSIDDWMWKLFGADLPKSMNLKWIMERVERCERQIWSLAKQIVTADGIVILDLAFTKIAKRRLFLTLAEEIKASTQLHYITAAHNVRRKRVLVRNIEQGSSYSFEVTPGMFDFMETEFQTPTESEMSTAIIVDTSEPKGVDCKI